MLNIMVPAGIGDISWSYSKLADLDEKLNVYISADNPKRSLDYVKMLPNVEGAQYDTKNFHQVADHSIPYNTSKESFFELARKQIVNFSPNRWLEAGHRLESWMSELPTNFHYKMNLSDDSKGFIPRVKSISDFLIGIYPSAYYNIAHWGGWHINEWKALLESLHRTFPTIGFVIVGAEYDKPFADDLSTVIHDIPHLNIAGQTTVSDLCHVLKQLKYFIAFPSGLSVLCNVFEIPTMMFYPNFLTKIINTWADPKTIANKTYKGCVFPKWEEVKLWLLTEYRLDLRVQEVKK